MEINETIEFIWFLVQGGISILYIFILASIIWIVVTPTMSDREKSYTVTTRIAGATFKRHLEKSMHQAFWRKHINRCVFSSDNLKDDKEYLEYLSKLTKVRITHLVTADTTFAMIEAYLEFQKEIGCQFTIKQPVGYDDNDMYRKIREKYPEIYYLNKGDYNIYYMSDNSIRETFL
jgi:hypothetical protein